jgi:hypothetical protein
MAVKPGELQKPLVSGALRKDRVTADAAASQRPNICICRVGWFNPGCPVHNPNLRRPPWSAMT